MNHVVDFMSVLETQGLDDYVSFEHRVREANLKFSELFPGESIKMVYKNGHTAPVLDKMWKNRPMLMSARPAVIGVTELSAPTAFAFLKTMSVGSFDKLISTATFSSPKTFKLHNGLIVTFAQLKLGEMLPDSTQAWEYVALVNIDEFDMLIDALKSAKAGSERPSHRRSIAPSYEKATAASGGLMDKIKKIRKMPDGSVDYGQVELSHSEMKKFVELRRAGKLRFNSDGVIETVE